MLIEDMAPVQNFESISEEFNAVGIRSPVLGL
jgi:hypothetical protein